jgi:hypothetical protein
VKTIQPKHRMTTITDTREIASAQRNGLHDVKATQTKDGAWIASSASVAKFRKIVADGRSEEFIEFGFEEPRLNPNEEGM